MRKNSILTIASLMTAALFTLACDDDTPLADGGPDSDVDTDTDSDADGCPDDMVEVPGHGACIDRYEYTNEKFLAFLNENGNGNDCGEDVCRVMGEESSHIANSLQVCEALEYADYLIGYDITSEDGEFLLAEGVGDFPVSWVTWYGARDACLWEGKTMCPWDVFYAACSNDGQWYLPGGGETGGDPTWYGWIDAWEKCMCNGWSNSDAPIGQFTDCEGSIEGLFDMAGNIGEWGGTRDLDGYWTYMGGSHDSIYQEDGTDVHAGAACVFPDYQGVVDVPGGDLDYLFENESADDLGFRCCKFLE